MMRTPKISPAVLFTLFLILWSSKSFAKNISNLEGQVFIRGFGDILPGAVLELKINDATFAQTKSDDSGHFQFKNIPANSYQLIAQLQGFRKTVLTVKVEENKTSIINVGIALSRNDDIEFHDAKGNVIPYDKLKISRGGVVRQSDGKPIADATVVLISLFSQQTPQECHTDKNGEYLFDTTAEGQYIIYVYKSGFKAQTETLWLHYPLFDFKKDFLLKTRTENE